MDTFKTIKASLLVLLICFTLALNGEEWREGVETDFSLTSIAPHLPKNVRYLVHVNVQQALEERNAQELKRLWIIPMLEAYGSIVSPGFRWRPEEIGSISYFGDGVYTNYSDQVYLFKPVSAQWTKRVEKSLEENKEAPARYGYAVAFKNKNVYVSQSKEKLQAALHNSQDLPPLFEGIIGSKMSYIDLVFDQQIEQMFLLPPGVSQGKKKLERFRLDLWEEKEKCFIEAAFDFHTASDATSFSKQIQLPLKMYQLVETGGLIKVLKSATTSINGQTMTMKADVPSIKGETPEEYFFLLESLFGVKADAPKD